MALKSQSTLSNTTLTFACSDSETGESFTREVDLLTIVPNASGIALMAANFAVKTALRNSTGGRELDEAESAVDARLAAWAKGEWGAERSTGDGGAPFTAGNVLAKAVARVYSARFPDAAAAAEELSRMLEAQLVANSAPTFAELEEEKQRAARNAFTKAARTKDAAVDAAVSAIQAEQATARAAKKAGATSSGSLFG